METLQAIQIQRAADNEYVRATIVRLSAGDARTLIDKTWWNLPDVPEEKLREEGDSHWPWAAIVESYGVGLKESYNAGLGGRIALESLPTPNTVKFYEAKGFQRTDLTQPLDGLMDYELPKDKAEEWLRREGDWPK